MRVPLFQDQVLAAVAGQRVSIVPKSGGRVSGWPYCLIGMSTAAIFSAGATGKVMALHNIQQQEVV